MLKEPPVERDDIFTVIDKVKPSVSQEDIAKCVDWTEKFGAEGA
jgi:vacuolar protein-sorting-associated protein 4